MSTSTIPNTPVATETRRYRKGAPITTRDERFVKALNRQIKTLKKRYPDMSMSILSQLLGFHKDYLRRVASLTERPSREAAEAIAFALDFTDGQMRHHSAYFRSLPPASAKVVDQLSEIRAHIKAIESAANSRIA